MINISTFIKRLFCKCNNLKMIPLSLLNKGTIKRIYVCTKCGKQYYIIDKYDKIDNSIL